MKLIISSVLLTLLLPFKLFANNISIEQVSKDIHFLADDKLEGRKVYSEGIDKAADYIAGRFKDIGLQPLSGQESFKQTFPIFQITPKSVQVELEGQTVQISDVMTFTAFENLSWDLGSQVKIEVISAEMDFRQSISKLNQREDNLLVLVNTAHKDMFNRYRNHFSKGLTKFSINQGPSAVFVLTDKNSLSKADIKIQTQVKKQQLANVVGVLPGEKLAHENVLFSAHYDHVGRNPEKEGDQIFNGADDDASGTTAVINLAEYFARKSSHNRTLIFVAFTAEEIGGFGSKYFSSQLDPKKIAAMINIEMIGKPSKFGAGKLWMTGYERSNLAELLNKSLPDAQIYPDPYPQHNLFYRSDNATLARLGVPAHSFSSSQIDIDEHYHKASDEVSTLDIESMHQVIQSLAKAVDGLVKGTATPTRIDTSQVRKSGSFY